jgi:hypothetical protein
VEVLLNPQMPKDDIRKLVGSNAAWLRNLSAE